jgi:hypothetical protein
MKKSIITAVLFVVMLSWSIVIIVNDYNESITSYRDIGKLEKVYEIKNGVLYDTCILLCDYNNKSVEKEVLTFNNICTEYYLNKSVYEFDILSPGRYSEDDVFRDYSQNLEYIKKRLKNKNG